MSNFKAGWYLIYTMPRHEKKVAAGLSELRIEHFLPTIKTLRKWWDRKKYIDAPMFPSYVFVYLKDMQDYFHASGVEGALCYVKFGREIAMVRTHVIDSLKIILANSQEIEVSDVRFQPGRQLVIQQGVFAGFACEVVEYKNEQKLIVRINLLNTSVLASIPANMVLCAEAG